MWVRKRTDGLDGFMRMRIELANLMDFEETPAHALFRAWKRNRSNSEIAAMLHVDPSRVSRWLSGSRPDLPQVLALRKRARIKPELWLTAGELALLNNGKTG